MNGHAGGPGESGVAQVILHCWRDGSLGIARELPPGAIELVRGGQAMLQGVLLLARDAAQPKGVDRLPGMSMELDDDAARRVLETQMLRLEGLVGGGVSFNRQLDARFPGQG